MRPEFEFNYERSVNAPCGKSLEEKIRLAKSCMRIACGSEGPVIIIDPDQANNRLERFMPYREVLVKAEEKKVREEDAE